MIGIGVLPAVIIVACDVIAKFSSSLTSSTAQQHFLFFRAVKHYSTNKATKTKQPGYMGIINAQKWFSDANLSVKFKEVSRLRLVCLGSFGFCITQNQYTTHRKR